jgi:hypothetical protein
MLPFYLLIALTPVVGLGCLWLKNLLAQRPREAANALRCSGMKRRAGGE